MCNPKIKYVDNLTEGTKDFLAYMELVLQREGETILEQK